MGTTPADTPCRVLWSPPADGAAARALLDGAERARYERLEDPGDRARFVTGRALARTALGALLGADPRRVPISRHCRFCGRPDGKPFVPGAPLGFSLSHSGERVVFAVARGAEIGVDVQRVSVGNIGRIAERVLSGTEHRQWNGLPDGDRAYAFAVYWARKEALLKSVGRGISIPKRDIHVSAPAETAALIDWRGEYRETAFGLTDLRPGDEYAAALAVHGGGGVEVTERVLGDPLEAFCE